MEVMDMFTVEPASPMPPPPLGNRPHAIVIGSGFGGLAAAVRLGARGYRVTVLEKLDAPGGRAYVFRQDGFVFDAGPTIVTAPFLFEELWQMCGRRFADDVDLRPMNPFYRIIFNDGTSMECSGDPAQMRTEVGRLSPADVAGYERFMEVSKGTYRVGFEQLGHLPFNSWFDMVKVAPAMARLQSYRTIYGLAAKYVKDARLRFALSFHPLFVGGNPFNVTSIYSLISHLERTHGVHFAMGGTGELVKGLVSLIEGQGNSLRCNSQVSQITLNGRKATGVRLASGEEIRADVVVSNAEVGWTYRNLLPPEARPHWTNRRIEKARYSMSAFVWYFGTKRKYPEVAHHTIVLGPRYREHIEDIFERKILSDDFSLYLHRPTATDPSMAPDGCDAFYVLSPVPHMGSGLDWQREAEPYRRKIMESLSKSLLPDLEANVVSSMMVTPQDFQDRLLSTQGAAFGMEPVLTQSAWFRPHNRSEDIEHLYLVGGGTHPGAGLPGVLSSARVLDKVVPDAATFA
jgi:phytoene desaturase